MTRGHRRRRARGASHVGERLELEVGPVAHGGHCVARTEGPERRVVFVRHALPGERVLAQVTEGTDGDRFWRADAVEVLRGSADRTEPPCPHAGPDRCGGCDFQHVTLAAQRRLKADVVREQLSRLAGLDVEVTVEPVPGDEEGLRWRTRQRYVPLPDGRKGMRKHRSHEVVEVVDCLIEAAPVVEEVAQQPSVPVVEEVAQQPSRNHTVHDHHFEVAADGFWQVHPGAPAALVEAVLEALRPAPGERALDLYAGVGLFTRFLLDRVGPDGGVVAVEGDRVAARFAARNCPDAEVAAGDVARVLATAYPDPVDLVVLDPPRAGAKREVVAQVAARRPRAVAYVACDPAALGRDVGYFAEHGYRMSSLRAFDLFPMTHHVECVALLEASDQPVRGTHVHQVS